MLLRADSTRFEGVLQKPYCLKKQNNYYLRQKGMMMMTKIYRSKSNALECIEKVEDGCWINIIAPTEQELNNIASKLNVDMDFLTAALDDEERPRIDIDKDTDHTFLIVDIPFVELNEQGSKIYETFPLAIILTELCIITVCLKDSSLLQSFYQNNIKTFFTYKKSRFVLQILYKNASLYLQYLRQIDKHSGQIEKELHKSMKNKELIQLLDLEKSLVYFSTSLKSNELVLEKLSRFSFTKKYPDDAELLEDTIIENKQAIEMAKIYSDILSGTMDAFASVISNNLNIVMKFLASITIVMAIPTMIASFFGMNVDVPLRNNPTAFFIILVIAIIACILSSLFMAKKKMF